MPYKDPERRKLKQREYSKKHYEGNKQAAFDRKQRNRALAKVLWDDFKSTCYCEFCGVDHPAALDFHHPPGVEKLGHVQDFVRDGQITKAFAEAQKCICLCSNCHRILHHETRQIKKRGPKPPLVQANPDQPAEP